MLRVGLIGWRGMVGSVLMKRMREENDFAGLEPFFFSTSNIGGAAPREAGDGAKLKDAKDLRELSRCWRPPRPRWLPLTSCLTATRSRSPEMADSSQPSPRTVDFCITQRPR